MPTAVERVQQFIGSLVVSNASLQEEIEQLRAELAAARGEPSQLPLGRDGTERVAAA